MACIDDEWANFLSDGSIILSNEKISAKSNIKKSYSDCDKLSDNANNIHDSRVSKKMPLPLPLSSTTLSNTNSANSANSRAKTTIKKNTPNSPNTLKKCKKGAQLKNNDFSGESDNDNDNDDDDDADGDGLGLDIGPDDIVAEAAVAAVQSSLSASFCLFYSYV